MTYADFLEETIISNQVISKANDKLATSIRSLHFEAIGQMVSDEEIIGYYKNLQDKLVEAMCYADDCDWYISKLNGINAAPLQQLDPQCSQ